MCVTPSQSAGVSSVSSFSQSVCNHGHAQPQKLTEQLDGALGRAEKPGGAPSFSGIAKDLCALGGELKEYGAQWLSDKLRERWRSKVPGCVSNPPLPLLAGWSMMPKKDWDPIQQQGEPEV